MTQNPDVRRAEVLRVTGDVHRVYERVATTKKRRLLAPQLAAAIALLWDEEPEAGRAPAQFREITDDRLRQELVRLSQLDEQSDVVDEVKKLHQPTIVVLADFGCSAAHHAGQDDLVRLVAAAKGALQAHAYIRANAKASRSRTRARQTGIKGAPPNNRAAVARRMLAAHYKLLTGRAPTMTGRKPCYGASPGGQFFKLTKLVFAALNIEASVEAQTRQIAYLNQHEAFNQTFAIV